MLARASGRENYWVERWRWRIHLEGRVIFFLVDSTFSFYDPYVALILIMKDVHICTVDNEEKYAWRNDCNSISSAHMNIHTHAWKHIHMKIWPQTHAPAHKMCHSHVHVDTYAHTNMNAQGTYELRCKLKYKCTYTRTYEHIFLFSPSPTSHLLSPPYPHCSEKRRFSRNINQTWHIKLYQ